MDNPNVEIIKINDKTWRIEDGFVRFFLLEGNDKAMLIDSGFDTPNAKEIAESLTSKPVMLINTHSDGDHISGNDAFEEFYMHEQDFLYKDEVINSKPVFVKEGDVIDLGGRKLRIFDIPGHTRGSIAILDEKFRVIYTGDSVSTAIIYMFGEHRSINSYIASLKKIESISDMYDFVYPCHGEPVLDNSAVTKVKKELFKTLRGDIPYTNENLHDTDIRTYNGEFCGFYMPEKLMGCPVCGQYAFDEKYEICPVCGWENDPLQYKEKDFSGGANKDSVNSARKVFDNEKE